MRRMRRMTVRLDIALETDAEPTPAWFAALLAEDIEFQISSVGDGVRSAKLTRATVVRTDEQGQAA
jgi:hypothetical protein